MSNTTITVPDYLAEFVAEHGIPLTTPTTCSGCWEHPAIARDSVNEYCELCWARQQSYYEGKYAAMHTIASALLSAVRDAGLDEVLALRAVEYVVDGRDD